MISVYGATGFIGSKFCSLYPDEVVQIPRAQRAPESDQILYFISTIDNYNIFSDPHIDINTNLNLLIDVLEEWRSQQGTKSIFNFVSSWFVYGKTTDLPATEDTLCNPRGFYSITKRTAEQLLISYCETYNMNYRILRLANVYGEGDAKVSKKKNALQYMINEIAHNRDINLYDGGTHVRDYIYVEDVCSALKLCLDKGHINEIINIGTGIPHQVGYLLDYAKEKLNSTSTFNHVTPPDFHNVVQIKDMYLDIRKLTSLGFEPIYDIRQGLTKLLERYINEG